MSFLGCGSAFAQPLDWDLRGYQSRACGFDMNRNGTFGEAADCNVCDGVTTNVDDDAANETQVYVNCDVPANDDTSCGEPGDPCSTINYALNTRASGKRTTDGTDNVIVCFKGTCSAEPNNISMPDGDVGTYSDAAEGNQVRAWTYPTDPTMVVGWDADNDGSYPPFDTDDTAVMDGTGLDRAFISDNIPDGTHNFEMAHFTASNYGSGAAIKSIGFATLADGCHNCFFHDLELPNTNKDKPLCSNAQTFNHLIGENVYVYGSITNVSCSECGGYFIRGGHGQVRAAENGPMRVQHVTFTAHPCDNGACPVCNTEAPQQLAATEFMKVWGHITGIEVLNNRYDMNLNAWIPHEKSGVSFVVPNTCSQDWDIIDNDVIDSKIGINFQPDSGGFCGTTAQRRITPINVTGNRFRWTTNSDKYLNSAIRGFTWSGVKPASYETVEDLTVTNNFFTSAVDVKTGIFINAGYGTACGGGHGGAIVIDSNTIDVHPDSSTWAVIQIGDADQGAPACPHDNITINNNIVNGITTAGVDNIKTKYAPTTFTSNFNVFDSDGDYEFNGTNYTTLAAWVSGQSQDANSTEACTPTFVNTASGDYHLTSGDTCAKGAGSTTLTVDIDDQTRGTPDDIGADDEGAVTGCSTNADCDDMNVCTDDTCTATVCGNVNNTASCDDSDLCNGTDTCASGVCAHTGNPCSAHVNDGDADCSETCNAGTGACTDNDPAGYTCTDSLFCTTPDTCDGAGACSGGGDPCNPGETCDDVGDVCTGAAGCQWETSCTWTDGSGDTGAGTRNYRSVVDASRCTVAGNPIRITVQAETNIADGTARLDGTAIGPQDDVTVSDYETVGESPTAVTWGGGNAFQNFTSAQEIVSDEITLPKAFDPGINYLWHMYMTDRQFERSTETDGRTWDGTAVDGSLDTVGPTGSTSGEMWGMVKLEVCNPTGGCSVNADCADDGACRPGICSASACTNIYDENIAGCLKGSLLGCVVNCLSR